MEIPLPMKELLTGERLCFLATCHREQPHLSLMNFTYLPEEQTIILSSRYNTTKVQNIQMNPAVAVLLYRLDQPRSDPLSCTIHGRAEILSPKDAGPSRQAHAKRHTDMSAFIAG